MISLTEETTEAVQTTNAPSTSVAEAVRDGASDAMARAKQAVPAIGKHVSRFVYSGAYYLSYAVVFPTLLVTNFVPGCGPIGDGLVDGATAASDVLAEMKEKSAARKAAQAAPQAA